MALSFSENFNVNPTRNYSIVSFLLLMQSRRAILAKCSNPFSFLRVSHRKFMRENLSDASNRASLGGRSDRLKIPSIPGTAKDALLRTSVGV